MSHYQRNPRRPYVSERNLLRLLMRRDRRQRRRDACVRASRKRTVEFDAHCTGSHRYARACMAQRDLVWGHDFYDSLPF